MYINALIQKNITNNLLKLTDNFVIHIYNVDEYNAFKCHIKIVFLLSIDKFLKLRFL